MPLACLKRLAAAFYELPVLSVENGWENNHTTPRSMDDWCKLAGYFSVSIEAHLVNVVIVDDVLAGNLLEEV